MSILGPMGLALFWQTMLILVCIWQATSFPTSLPGETCLCKVDLGSMLESGSSGDFSLICFATSVPMKIAFLIPGFGCVNCSLPRPIDSPEVMIMKPWLIKRGGKQLRGNLDHSWL